MPTEITTPYSATLESLGVQWWINAQYESKGVGSDHVTTLTDQSGNGIDFTPSVAGREWGIVAGPPIAYDADAADFDQYDHASGIPSIIGDFWAVAIGYTDGDSVWLSGVAAGYFAVFAASSEMRFHDGSTLIQIPMSELDAGTHYVFQWARNSGDVSVWVTPAANFTGRGAALGTLTAAGAVPAMRGCGYFRPGGSNHWNGRVVESWITTTRPSTAVADAVIIDALQDSGLLPPDPAAGGDGRRYRGYARRLRGREVR